MGRTSSCEIMTKRRRGNGVKDDSECGTNGVNESDEEVQSKETTRRSRGANQTVKYYESDEDASRKQSGRKSDKRNGVEEDETERKPGRRSTQKKTYVEEKESDISDNEEAEKPIRKKEGRNSKKSLQ